MDFPMDFRLDFRHPMGASRLSSLRLVHATGGVVKTLRPDGNDGSIYGESVGNLPIPIRSLSPRPLSPGFIHLAHMQNFLKN